MAKKLMTFKTKGMNRDLSVSAFNPEFAFENINLRLSTNENNTLLSWVNEKGTLPIKILDNAEIKGIPIGTAIIDHKLILFTTDWIYENKQDDSPHDYIYKLTYEDTYKTIMNLTCLYNGSLNFSTRNPLETLVSYEAEKILKVYWVDGRNQPRVINIEGKIKENIDTQFDFVPAINTENLEVTIENKVDTGGTFAPGVIQYAFTYLNKNGLESNIAYVSPLYYLAHESRGESPEGKVANTFVILIQYADTNFEYVRLYSIQRTSIDAAPFVKRLEDLIIQQGVPLTYIDNGTTGATLDPTELLYVGGREITALTMIDKDNTLFLGNLREIDNNVQPIQELIDATRNLGIPLVSFASIEHSILPTKGFYAYDNQLDKNSSQITTFKGGEYYRLGFQLLKVTGEWSEPIYIDDVLNTIYPQTTLLGGVSLAYAHGLNTGLLLSLGQLTIPNFSSIYKNVRPLIVYPNIADRKVLCQGVLNPTVFNIEDRVTNSPFSQASWYFRPYFVDKNILESQWSEAEDTEAEETSDNDTLVYNTIEESIRVDVDEYTEQSYDASSFDFGTNDEFEDSELTRDVYIIVARVRADLVSDIITRGSLRIQNIRTNTTTRHSTFIIKLSDDEDPWFAFVSDTSWPNIYLPVEGEDVDVETFRYVDLVEGTMYRCVGVDSDGNVDFAKNSVHMYTGMRVSLNHELYYTKNTNANSDPDLCYLNFLVYYNGVVSIGSGIEYIYRYYRITFGIVNSNLLGSWGSTVTSTHYESLPAIDNGEDLELSNYRNVEIQYSRNEYNSIYATRIIDLSSNTLFFVDQSIVTLNSPDIEFDPEVQGYGTEGLGLRIVGVIPITSNASFHKITIGSPMLESWHNYHEDRLTSEFGQGEKNYNVFYTASDTGVGLRLVSEFLWNDVEVVSNPAEDDKIHTNALHDYLIYPWLKTGSLNNDVRPVDTASSLLKTKKESNILISNNSLYHVNALAAENLNEFNDIDCKLHLTENLFVNNIRLDYASSKFSNGINYYPNIDKVLYNRIGGPFIVSDGTLGNYDNSFSLYTAPVSMRYKSTSHAVISLSPSSNEELSVINILPSIGDIGVYTPEVQESSESSSELEILEEEIDTSNSYRETFWGDNISVNLRSIQGMTVPEYSFLWLGELYRINDNQVRFGGKTKEALKANDWFIAGDTIPLSSGLDLQWVIGDTYYLRYDCLKTYPFSPEDPNLIIEILSFMCETHVNIDGRYDRNRGLIDNTDMSPLNFNLYNTIYSLLNNYFTYKKYNETTNSYPNQLAYTKTKISGADVDLWTNTTLASVLELDGDKGKINSLRRLNNLIIAFQDTGIALILYNENTLLTTEEGVPVELGNSGKVLGKRYLNNTIGCSNKWSITQTPSGIYFMDSNDKSIYLFNGEFKNITGEFGFNTWAKLNIPSSENIWTPDRFKHFISYYDKLNLEVLFIGDTKALAWNEKLGTFTAFYDYQYTPYFVNLDDTGIWIRNPYTERITNGFIEYPTSIWKHNAGEYCNFFGDIKEYSMTLVGNPEPLLDKIFTNIEFRACVDGEGYTLENGKYIPLLPFDTLETWNEYQYGTANLGIRNSHAAFKHHHSANGEDTLKRKFRIWRCDIPRDNYGKYEGFKVDNEDFNPLFFGGQSKGHPLDRMRNPWIYIKLTGNKENVKASEINKFNRKAAAVFEFTPNTSGNYYIHLGDTSFLNDYLRDLLYFETKAYVDIAEDGEDPIYQEITLLYRVNVRPYSSLGQYESIGQINASSSILDSALINTMKSIRSNNSDIDIGLQASSQQLNSYDPTKVKIEVLAYDKYSPDGTDSKTYDLLENSRVEVHDVVMTYYG